MSQGSKSVVILGATGSVGSNTLAVIREHPESFRVTGLVAGSNCEKLAALAREFPEAALALGANGDPTALKAALAAAGYGGRLYAGPDGAKELLEDIRADIIVAAVSGTAGLDLAFAAIRPGVTILLANKEVLVSAGHLFMNAAKTGDAEVLPLDSEHTALWQCLEGHDPHEVENLVITASGGPFREWTAERMARAVPADALKHPVWRMGAKISVDSATLANKALELIEAHHLFGIGFDAMRVLVHPQSAVHGLIEFVDGSLIAHMGICDMRQPISYMLFHPRRTRNNLPRLDLAKLARLDFFEPDHDRFPLLGLGMEAGRRGGRAPALFNAANEAAVELFLAERLSFSDIARAVEAVMIEESGGDITSLDEVREMHEVAKRKVMEFAGEDGK